MAFKLLPLTASPVPRAKGRVMDLMDGVVKQATTALKAARAVSAMVPQEQQAVPPVVPQEQQALLSLLKLLLPVNPASMV